MAVGEGPLRGPRGGWARGAEKPAVACVGSTFDWPMRPAIGPGNGAGAPNVRVIVGVMTRAVATLALAVAIVGLPLAGLFCDDSGPAAMACCRDKASECNQPGQNDDCCRKAPIDKDASAGPTQQLAGKPHWTSVISFDALVASAPTLVTLVASLTPRLAPATSGPDPAPPPVSVLRV